MNEIRTSATRTSPSLDRIRERARLSVESAGLRRVARAVGMGCKSLERFLDGGPIRNQSRHCLFEWLTLQDVPPEVRTLVRDLPARQQCAAAREILQVLRRHHLSASGGVPEWMTSGPSALGRPREGGESEGSRPSSMTTDGGARARVD